MDQATERHSGQNEGFLAGLAARPRVAREEFEISHGGLASWQIRRVTEHIRNNMDRPLALNELAALVRLSRFHFCTGFRIATGRTPYNWLTDERIRRAMQLLEGSSLSVTEIALEVGYETPSSFAARFKERVGVTPSQYRRTC